MTLTENEIMSTALDWRAAGRGVALCTVVETWGSAPKPTGSHLIVDGEGAFLGSVSGGCIEGDVIAEAIDAVASGKPALLEFGLSDEKAWQAGLTCGGRIKVFVERLDDTLAACLDRMVEDHAGSTPNVLVTALDGGPPGLVRPDEQAGHPLAPQLAEAFRSGKSRLVAHGDRTLFLTASLPATRLVVFGAVHIAQALAPIARLGDMEMIVVDPRSAFATPERFPDTTLIVEWPDDVAGEIRLGPHDAVAVVSHDPRIDDQGLMLALQANCFYVGALGSRKSHARRLDRLRAAGIGEPDLHRLHAPIGLAIGAEGPAEIAISIAAEIISVQRAGATAASAAA